MRPLQLQKFTDSMPSGRFRWAMLPVEGIGIDEGERKKQRKKGKVRNE